MMHMFSKNDVLFLISVIAVLCAVLLWPLSYPTEDNEELSGPTGAINGTEQKRLENIELSQSQAVVGVVFSVAGEPTFDPDALVELLLTNRHTGEVVFSQVKRFSEVFNQEENTLRFSFPKINNSYNTYSISLRVPDATNAKAFSIRGPLQDVENKKSAVAVVQTVERRSVLSVFYKKLYRGKTEGEDIYYYWARGGQVANGDNPYICALDDTCINHKNPGHFPFFYWLSSFSIQFGFEEFEDWIALWRPIFLLCYLGTGVILFWVLYRKKLYELAVFALFFWLFNRWSLYVIRVGHVDFLAILFLITSIVLFEKKRFWSVFFFGLSLATKQVAVFLAPVYLILIWVRAEKEKRLKAVSLALVAMSLAPLITVLPFVLDNPQSVAKGLLFSATRTSEANMGATPLVSLLKIQGALGVVPMAFLMGCIYVAAFRKKLSLATSGLAIMLIFLAFNTVTFNQYFLWFVPLLPLALAERKKS